MNEKLDLTQSEVNTFPRICWSAIFAGAFIGVGLGFLLQLYGVAIGLSAFNTSANGAATIAIGGFIGFLIGIIASMGVAGFVSGYLGRFHYCHCHGGVIYGFLTWSIALLLSAAMALPLMHYASAYNKALAPTISVNESMPQSVAISSNAASDAKNKPIGGNETEVQVTPNTLTGASWIIFILFFVGAISSTIGACMGIRGKHCGHKENI